jgi:hypothetical protein
MLSAAASIQGFSDLHWYCSEGQTAFHRSNFGAQIERLERYAFARGDRYDDRTESRIGPKDDREQYMRVKSTSSGGGYLPREGVLERWSMVNRVLDAMREVDPVLPTALCAPLSDAGVRLSRPAGGSLNRRSSRWTLGDMIALYPLTASGQLLMREAAAELAADRKAKRAKAEAEAPPEPSNTVPWEWQDEPGGPWRLTTRPRVVKHVAGFERARVQPSALQVVNEMLRPREHRLALQAAAELEAIELFGRAVQLWNATRARLYPPDED